MLSYAESLADLALAPMNPLLRTGDLGYRSADGLWFYHRAAGSDRSNSQGYAGNWTRWAAVSRSGLGAGGLWLGIRRYGLPVPRLAQVAVIRDYLQLQLGLHPASLFRVAALQRGSATHRCRQGRLFGITARSRKGEVHDGIAYRYFGI